MVADHDSKIMELVRRELDTLYHLIKIIDTLAEEPISEGLEEEMNRYLEGNGMFVDADNGKVKRYNGDSVDNRWDYEDIARHFANWQKEQMMKDTIEAKVVLWEGLKSFALAIHDMDKALSLFNDGDKVKLLIIKED